MLLEISAVGMAFAAVAYAVNTIVLTQVSVFAKDSALRRRARRAHRQASLSNQLLAAVHRRHR